MMNADRLPLIRSPGFFAEARPLPYVLLVCFFAQVVLAGPRLSLTADEPVHMAQGYVYWTRRDWRFAWAVAQPPCRMRWQVSVCSSSLDRLWRNWKGGRTGTIPVSSLPSSSGMGPAQRWKQPPLWLASLLSWWP